MLVRIEASGVCHTDIHAAVAVADFAVPVPDAVSSFDAAPLSCAGVTTCKAVMVSGARSSDLVALYGIGGLGHLAVRYARIAGGSVVDVDVEDAKLALAMEAPASRSSWAPDARPSGGRRPDARRRSVARGTSTRGREGAGLHAGGT